MHIPHVCPYIGALLCTRCMHLRIMHEVIWLIFAWTTVSPWLTLSHLCAGYCYCPPSPSSNVISQRLCVAPDYITTPCQCLSDVCEVRILTNVQHCISCCIVQQGCTRAVSESNVGFIRADQYRRFTIGNTSVADKLVMLMPTVYQTITYYNFVLPVILSRQGLGKP